MRNTKLLVGDWVEVRSKEDILQTLDGHGELERLPFMPEMFKFCGQRFRVLKSAHKTCDTVFPTRSRRLSDTVHLDTRCDGTAHGGCEAACPLFWKMAWLRPVGAIAQRGRGSETANRKGAAVTEEAVRAATMKSPDPTESDHPTYRCQATQLPYYTEHLAWWDVRQYAADYFSGNVSLRDLAGGAVYATYYGFSQAGIGLGKPLRWLWNILHPLWRGTLFPRTSGSIPPSEPTPRRTLNLCPGELVRVKNHGEILRTLNVESKNRGMLWDAEMVPFCGGTYPVRHRVRRLIDERTGKLIMLKNDAVVLDGVSCQARYSTHRMFCPRGLYPFWREIWLERLADGPTAAQTATVAARDSAMSHDTATQAR